MGLHHWPTTAPTLAAACTCPSQPPLRVAVAAAALSNHRPLTDRDTDADLTGPQGVRVPCSLHCDAPPSLPQHSAITDR